MKNWRNVVLAVLIAIGVVVLFRAFSIRINFPSGNFDFSPDQEVHQAPTQYAGTKPKNVIIFIADGMGFSHLSLALLPQSTSETASVWREFDVRAWHDPRCAYGPLTDSGASATAIATGTPTQFEVLGQDSDGNKLTNVFEVASSRQYSTGIVTDSYFWDATPAAFVAHTDSRRNAREIMKQIAESELDLIFGELEDVGEDGVPEVEETLLILRQRFQLLDESLEIPDRGPNPKPVAAVFAEDQIQDMNSSPNLRHMTDTALKHLTSLGKPFMLLVESEEMDDASHKNNSKRVITGLESIQETLALILDYAKDDGETLVLFTSDHECGGLAAVSENYPKLQIRWATSKHTAAVVPLLAKGPGAKHFADVERNWHIGQRLLELMSPEKVDGDKVESAETLGVP